MIIGAIDVNTKGIVILLNFENAEAPSIVAASYKSCGMDCNTPVVTIKMYGNASQPCMKIKAIFDQVGSVIHGIGFIPNMAKISLLIAPKLSLNNPAKIKIVTKPGTAQGNISTVRMVFLNRKSF